VSTTAPYLIDLLPAGSNATVLFHEMGWFQKSPNGHRNVGYNSDDQVTVDRHLDMILAFGRGIPASRLGVILDWYGPGFKDPYIDKAGLLLKAGCEKRGMKLSLCFDHGIPDVPGAVAYAAQNYFGSPAFLRHSSGKLFVTDFNTSADWNTLSAQYGLHCCRWTNAKPGGYAWIKCGPGDNPTAIDTLCRENQLVEVPGVCAGFDDGDPANMAQSKWGGPRRTAGYENGQAWLRTWKSVPVEAQIIQVITLSDIDERTGIIGCLGESLPADCILPVGGVIPNVLSGTPALNPPKIPPKPTPIQQVPPAPKIDYQANILKAGAYLRACVAPDGEILMALDSPIVNPYFSNLAALGMCHDPACIPFVINWMKWYIAHENFPDKWGAMGTVYDASEVGGKSVSSNGADSTDSYAATFLSVAWALWNTGDATAQVYVKSIIPQLLAVAEVVLQTQQPDGLTWALPNYHQKYLMDNCEGYRGLMDFASLLRVTGAQYTGDYYGRKASEILNGLKFMWLGKLWSPSKDEAGTIAQPNLATWYPDAVCQLFPAMLGVDPNSQITYAAFNKSWPKWSTLEHGSDTFPWCLCAYAAAIMGDTVRANEFISAVMAKWANGFTWPFFSAEAGWFALANAMMGKK